MFEVPKYLHERGVSVSERLAKASTPYDRATAEAERAAITGEILQAKAYAESVTALRKCLSAPKTGLIQGVG